jgi:hypothetical protein
VNADLDRLPLRDLVDRYLDMSLRDLLARHTYSRMPLSPAEHVDLLTLGAAIGRYVECTRQAAVRRALLAGASWPDVTAACGTDEAAFLRWVDPQAALWDTTPPGRVRIGLSPADRATARRLANPPTDRKEATPTR